MDIELQRRSQRKDNFQRVFAWEKIDICRFVNDIDSYSSTMFKRYLTWANETFQGVIHKCPYRSLVVTNVTLSLDSFEFDTIVPNGEVKLIVKLYNNRDRNIGTFHLTWIQSLIDE